MNKLSLFLSVLSLLFAGFVYKLHLDQSNILAEQEMKIMDLYEGDKRLADRIEGIVEIGQGLAKSAADSGKDDSSSSTSKRKKIKMKEGYYCLTEVKGDNSVVYFDGIDRMKSWGDADGTASFKNTTPDGVGKYVVSGSEIVLNIQNRVVNKDKVTRILKVLSTDDDGEVLEFDAYRNIFSFNGCPWK